MNKQTEAMQRRLSTALTAVGLLARAGLTVLDVSFKTQRPIIQISPPRRALLSAEPVMIYSRENGKRSRVFEGEFKGCRIQWHASELH